MYLSVGDTAKLAGVSISTLRRWETEERFTPCYRTKRGHRRYSLHRIKTELLGEPISSPQDRKCVAYARVSSYDQKRDLGRQIERLSAYCEKAELTYEVISDLGSGINYKKKGLIKLINMLAARKVSKLILTHRDRLLRFGSQLLFKLCELFGTEVVIIDAEKDELDFERALVADVIEIMTVFTARMYGRRSHRNKKAVAA